MRRIWLLDQDCVLADFSSELQRRLQARYPELPLIPLEKHTSFEFTENYAEEHKEKIKSIYREPGFFLGLLPVPGGLEAARSMLAEGIDVRICTSSISNYENCVGEKYAWIERYLGKEWVKRIVLTSDKTLVRGEILIDDKPEITGALVPEWEHIVFDQPYNRSVEGGRRLTGWKNWKQVLLGKAG